jgi:hypothetical protein
MSRMIAFDRLLDDYCPYCITGERKEGHRNYCSTTCICALCAKGNAAALEEEEDYSEEEEQREAEEFAEAVLMR